MLTAIQTFSLSIVLLKCCSDVPRFSVFKKLCEKASPSWQDVVTLLALFYLGNNCGKKLEAGSGF